MKKLKMVLYGEPGSGKSVFAGNAPKPFFITTDGNYEWLEGLVPNYNEKNHIQVNTWAEAKKVFAELNKPEFDEYETIVIDLVEDLFKWCEQEFCIKNKLEHVGDMGYAKGYQLTRDDFTIQMFKLIGLDKHIIFIMHGMKEVVKDRRGVELTKYIPTNRLPDKVLDPLEGRVRYFLRVYLKGEEQKDGSIIKRRYLSLIPKENEYGIARGVNENEVPHDIPLIWDVFANCIGLDNTNKTYTIDEVEKIIEEPQFEEPQFEKVEIKEEPVIVEQPVETPKVETKKEELKPQVETNKEESNEDRIAKIRAMLAAKQNK